MASEESVAIGVVRRAVGLEGWCAIQPFGDTLGSLGQGSTVLIGDSSADARPMVIVGFRKDKEWFHCRFDGLADRTAAEGMRGQLLFVARHHLNELPANVYYQFELEGMAVLSDLSGETIGSVIAVHNHPSVDTIEVSLPRGGTVLVPLSEEAVADVDRENKRITVRCSFIEELLP